MPIFPSTKTKIIYTTAYPSLSTSSLSAELYHLTSHDFFTYLVETKLFTCYTTNCLKASCRSKNV